MRKNRSIRLALADPIAVANNNAHFDFLHRQSKLNYSEKVIAETFLTSLLKNIYYSSYRCL